MQQQFTAQFRGRQTSTEHATREFEWEHHYPTAIEYAASIATQQSEHAYRGERYTQALAGSEKLIL